MSVIASSETTKQSSVSAVGATYYDISPQTRLCWIASSACGLLAMTLLALILTGCSTLVHERTQYIRFETPHAKGAECYVEDNRGHHWRTDTTPEVLKIEKDFPPLIVTCRKPGFHKTVLNIDEYYNPRIIGDFAADKVGYVLPTWQHSAHEYPSTITIWMRPLTFADEGKRLKWEQDVREFLRDEEMKKQANDKTVKAIVERNYQKIQDSWQDYDPPFRGVKRAKVLVGG